MIQPIWIGTWFTLCLLAAAAMLAQIPYSLDELLATTQFLLRRRRTGQSLLRVFFVGDTDEGAARPAPSEFERSQAQLVRDMVSGGVNLPCNLAGAMLIGVWLMSTRLTLGADGAIANADHLIGALIITISAIACAEVARPVRFLNIPFGVALLVTPFLYEASALHMVVSISAGLGLIALSLRRGRLSGHYAAWNRYIV